MTVKMVQIVNPNGRIGHVAETYPPYVAGKFRDLPSARDDAAPARNGSTDDWRSYAKSHGMDPEFAATQSRDELIAYYDEVIAPMTENPNPTT